MQITCPSVVLDSPLLSQVKVAYFCKDSSVVKKCYFKIRVYPVPIMSEEDFPDIHLQVLYDFEYVGKDERKIRIQEGEKLFLIKKTNADWWQVIRSSAEKPFFVPAAYVKEYSCSQDTSKVCLFLKGVECSLGSPMQM
jgi:hypothetical protein